jgi:hypothetical protein
MIKRTVFYMAKMLLAIMDEQSRLKGALKEGLDK